MSDDKHRFVPGTRIASGISGAFELLGQTARQFTNPRTLAVAGSAAGVAAAAGQAGPQIALPEEVVTVPVAFLSGLAAGSAASSFEIEGGLAYSEMVNAGVSKDTAAKIALAVGGVNAGLELLQVDELLDAYKITKATGATKTFAKKIFDELLDRGVDVAKQTTQEVVQEGVTIAGVQVGSKIDNGKAAYTAEEVKSRLWDTAQSSALSFGLMNVPAAAKNLVSHGAGQNAASILTDTEQKPVDKATEALMAEERNHIADLAALDDDAYFRELQKYVDEGTVDDTLANLQKDDIIRTDTQSGALTSKNDPNYTKRESFAISYYKEVTGRNRDIEIAAVSKNSGMSTEDIDKVFSHVFELDHLFADGRIGKFDPDYFMAQSWIRLREGKNIQEHDLILLKHELMEAQIMGTGTTIPYEIVHNEVSKTYDYVKALKQYLQENHLE